MVAIKCDARFWPDQAKIGSSTLTLQFPQRTVQNLAFRRRVG